ncbi:MAG: sulfite exporter TauE/SafE family protein [Candidatus Kapaibacteriales bacterium]
MELALQLIAVLVASILTFFSGFGLGTILLPVLLLSFEPLVAISYTAFVHFLNNVFKTGILWKEIDRLVVLKFGLGSIVFAILGSFLISELSIETKTIEVLIGFLIICFTVFDIIPISNKISFFDNLYLGGALSGFFGGISGHQGALRSAFLIRLDLSKYAYIATGTAISLFIDASRIPIYLINGDINLSVMLDYKFVALSATSVIGVLLGRKLLKKSNIKVLRITVAIFLIVTGGYMIFR